ncbi:hypothetical protein ACN6MY_00490 [Peribacillus sp. B-H-3]|uniref:hypothetical protein n=1 Tax=Peribacillus sp. B-H-3 TaxID=3400420 RepID=UPI003B028A0C
MNSGENEPVEKKPSEMKEEKLPKTRAFQDEFTRGFISSTDEAENGYYTFKSKTGRYTLLFPEGGSISEESYSYVESKSESFLTGIKNKDLPSASLSVSYSAETSNTAKGIKYSLKFLKSQADMKEPFQQKKTNDSVIHWSPFTIDQDAYGYGAYIHPTTGKGGIEMIYSIKSDSAGKCDFNKEIKNQATKIFSSIRFDYNKESSKANDVNQHFISGVAFQINPAEIPK